MLIPAPITIPESWQKRYQILRVTMYLIISVITVIFALRVLFPVITQSFDFRAPSSSKNDILSPRSPDNATRTNGKIEAGGTIIADTTVVGNFSLVATTVVLEKKSAVPETLHFTMRRGYQSFFYPTGAPVADFPEETTYLIGDTYYALRGDILFPYVSQKAYLSRFPKEHSLAFDTFSSLPKHVSVSDTWLGFRVGSLLSNGSGVFIVTSEAEVRPVGSADIFLALGYDFADVIPVSEEELGGYKRGRIFLLGAVHPDGTVLFDQDTKSYYIIDQSTKRPLGPGTYRDFLLKDRHPIKVSSKASEQSVDCSLVPTMFGSGFSCSTSITALASGFGNDFELRIESPKTDIDINNVTVSFETAKNKENMMTLLSQIKQRLFARFSGAS